MAKPKRRWGLKKLLSFRKRKRKDRLEQVPETAPATPSPPRQVLRSKSLLDDDRKDDALSVSWHEFEKALEERMSQQLPPKRNPGPTISWDKLEERMRSANVTHPATACLPQRKRSDSSEDTIVSSMGSENEVLTQLAGAVSEGSSGQTAYTSRVIRVHQRADEESADGLELLADTLGCAEILDFSDDETLSKTTVTKTTVSRAPRRMKNNLSDPATDLFLDGLC